METHYLVLDDNHQEVNAISSEYPFVCRKTDMTHYDVPWHWQVSRSHQSK